MDGLIVIGHLDAVNEPHVPQFVANLASGPVFVGVHALDLIQQVRIGIVRLHLFHLSTKYCDSFYFHTKTCESCHFLAEQ